MAINFVMPNFSGHYFKLFKIRLKADQIFPSSRIASSQQRIRFWSRTLMLKKFSIFGNRASSTELAERDSSHFSRPWQPFNINLSGLNKFKSHLKLNSCCYVIGLFKKKKNLTDSKDSRLTDCETFFVISCLHLLYRARLAILPTLPSLVF